MATIKPTDISDFISSLTTLSTQSKVEIVNASVPTTGAVAQKVTIQRLTEAVNKLETAFSNNCCQSANPNCCQSCESQTCQTCQGCQGCQTQSCQSASCQSCQSCQGCQTQTCQSTCNFQSCQILTCQSCQAAECNCSCAQGYSH